MLSLRRVFLHQGQSRELSSSLGHHWDTLFFLYPIVYQILRTDSRRPPGGLDRSQAPFQKLWLSV
jgi:hypothetical protein